MSSHDDCAALVGKGVVPAAYECASLNGVAPTPAALRVLCALEGAGIEAWFVGGWVRDALMGNVAHDIDMCASSVWQENEAALLAAGIDVVRSGIKFGGITAVCDGERFEVTTYRKDGFYADGRHPDEVVQAGSIEDDLARRDFTVNAMAWHPARGVLDLYDGVGDISRRTIRAVGEAHVRFEEDALRMLRAVRFACRLDFRPDEACADALRTCAPLICSVAAERIGTELCGILETRHGGEAMMRFPDLFCEVIPELAPARGFDQHSPYHAYDVYEHIARVLTVAGELSRFRIDGGDPSAPPSLSLMWAALLHDVGKPRSFTQDERGCGHFYGHPEVSARIARTVMRRLGLADSLVRDCCLLIECHDMPLEANRTSLLGCMRRLSADGLDMPRLMGELFDLKRADALGKAPQCFGYIEEIERMREMVRELIANGDAYSLKTLDLTGRDLIRVGVAPGPMLGAMLNRALDAVISGAVPNLRPALLSYLHLS